MANLKLALRMLVKTPFVTLVAVVSLALGIGANSAIFSLFDQMLLRPLPVHEPERLVNLAAPGPKPGSQSCNAAGDCNTVFTAKMPEGLGTEKYDSTAASIIALLRYGTGLPFTRLERLQENFGIPLPASTQWDIVERAAKLVEPAHKALIHEAAQGDVLYSDDTPMKVLALMKENEERKADDG